MHNRSDFKSFEFGIFNPAIVCDHLGETYSALIFGSFVFCIFLYIKVCAIKAPGFGENRRANLEDLAILTGGELITEDHDLNLTKVQVEMLVLQKSSMSLMMTLLFYMVVVTRSSLKKEVSRHYLYVST